ncbi:glycosyltransferase [Ornithinimicrobium panacihumi]|uniref:glycosyltransferase n=1 Tax=Ornithinimicrobium panacihumi TaxID=2008449 RepID=UPI003F8BCCE9
MYPDESRDHEVHRSQILADFVSDPASLHTKYTGLVARDRRLRSKVEELEKELKQLRKELRRERTTAGAVPDLTQRLGSANAALDAYRAETRRLKDDLARLRRSRALRLSRAAGDPLGTLKRLTRQREPAAQTSLTENIATIPAAETTRTPDADSTPTAEKRPGSTALSTPLRLWQKRPSECTYEELKQRLDERPTAEALGYVINRAWFGHGLVHEPAALLDAWPDLADSLTPATKVITGRIAGARRIAADARGWIPDRSLGVAYVPERNRLMYCVHSTPAYNSNGYSTRTRGVASALVSNGVQVRVVGRAGYPWDTKTDVPAPPRRRSITPIDRVDYVHLTGPNEHRDPPDRIVLQMADAFVREARLYRPSMIQAASNYRTGLAALIAARRLGLPFVYEVRGLWELTEASAKADWDQGDRFAITKQLETLVATEADHVLAITQEVADELIRRGVARDQISLLPNGVDTEQFTPLYPDERMRRRFASHSSGEPDLPTIGFAGSMVDYEGLDDLLEASAALHDEGVLHHLVLAGSGTAEPQLREIAQERGMEHVSFLGRLPASDIPRLLSVLDVVVCPRRSTLITELVSPLKPLEAMAAGRAVVLSDVAPNRSIAGLDGKRAVLHRADDPFALAAQLRPLLVDADARRRLGRHARRWVVQERTWVQLGKNIVAAHAQAGFFHLDAASSGRSIPLKDLRVAVVADEFTTTTLAAEVSVTELDRDGWGDQLDRVRPHLVLIESAWANSSPWHRGIGYYSDEEHADFRALIDSCRASGIPTVFWNKEDPVHFNRFLRAAVECDHIFTTDADMIPAYLSAATRAKTASALPFYAAPTIHNPLPASTPFRGGASYAGTFYGERYPKRSKELAKLLDTAAPFGLTIYDRQADSPDSPYRFPPHLQPYVMGGLPYGQVLDAYKSHIANLNVNSVADSPSMFSRRVVEVAASGAVILSAAGRGITETFGDALACSDQVQVWRSWLRAWTTSPEARRAEAWLQMRTVLRAHTAGTALTIVARTAGLRVQAPALPTYDIRLHQTSAEVLSSISAQSVLPTTIYCGDGHVPELDLPAGVSILTGHPEPDHDRAILEVHDVLDRTTAEDLLHATRWGRWSWVGADDSLTPEPPYARPSDGPPPDDTTVLMLASDADAHGMMLSRPARVRPEELGSPRREPALAKQPRLLIAGHDLKFARPLIRAAEERGLTVVLDEWRSHSAHDPERSRKLLAEADVVFCEWGLGNAVWYSKHLHPHQRLLVRVHAQELRRDYLRRINHSAVDRFIFVGRTILDSAVASHGVPRETSIVIPNPVDVDALERPKTGESRHTLGFVGAVPSSKRPDLALDLLVRLRERDPRYRLRIKGHTPDHYPWLGNLPGELAYYEGLEARIASINDSDPGAVIWDPHGDDMAEWFRQVGVAVSVSDHESFHFTVADGAASGALPAVLAWPGAEHLYPTDWLSADLDELVERVLNTEPTDEAMVIRDRYSATVVLPALLDQITAAVAPADTAAVGR